MKNTHFKDTLHYTSPAHGGWGVVRTGMLVPESYQLFVCPFACGRHGALGAILQGLKDRLSYLYIEEKDIVSGDYEGFIVEAVKELMDTLPYRPKVLMIFVSCLDDLLGTDHEPILDELRGMFPDMDFTVCHMNPISSDGKLPPMVNIQLQMYSLLKKHAKTENTVNLLGNLVPIEKEAELYALMESFGVEKVQHISDFSTYTAYQSMGQAQLNLVIAPAALAAAKWMEKQLGIPYIFLPVSYDLEEIDAQYQALADYFQKPLPSFLEDRKQRAGERIHLAKQKIGDIPIYIGDSAVVRPFTLAKALLSYGFAVKGVYANKLNEIETQTYEWVSRQYQEIEILQPQHPDVLAKNMQKEKDGISIGFECAYLTKTDHIVNLNNDEQMYGAWGVEKLMKAMEKAYEEKGDLEKMINEYGLVI